MTLRTALIAARRSSGRPCKYSSTVAALLFIKSFCVAEGEPGLEPRQAPSFFLHGRSADRVCDRRITEDRTLSVTSLFHREVVTFSHGKGACEAMGCGFDIRAAGGPVPQSPWDFSL